MGCKQENIPDMDDVTDLVLPPVGLDHFRAHQHAIVSLNGYIIARSKLQRFHNPPLEDIMSGTTHMQRAL